MNNVADADGDVGGGSGRRRLTRAEAKALTRERLLQAAAHVFARRGFEGASVEEIAESAGYSTGALYSNFANKEELFLELLSARRTRGTARHVTAVAEAFGAANDPAGDPFEQLTDAFVRAADRRSEAVVLQAEFWLYAVRHPEAMAVVAARLGDQVDALTEVVAAAMERAGVDSRVPARALTSVAVAMFHGLVRQRRIDPASVPDELFADGLRWLLAGSRVVADEPAGSPGRRRRGS